jgi:flagellar hook assembly protein FlgD
MFLRPSFPNPAPAGMMASVQFSLERPAHVVLRVIDANGRFVAEPFGAELSTGLHLVSWNGRTMAGAPAPRGLYFLSLQAAGQNFVSRRIID